MKWISSAAVAAMLALAGCSHAPTKASASTGTTGSGASASSGASLYAKYGGATTVKKLVDDVVAAEMADCEVAPYFTKTLGTPGHDGAERVKSCLRLELTALMGGPARYPGKTAEGYTCRDMAHTHANLGIPAGAFDAFITDFAGALSSDGLSPEDVRKISTALLGTKPHVVSARPVRYEACKDQPQG